MSAWPRNVRPLDDSSMSLLSDPANVGLWLLAHDEPVPDDALAGVMRVPAPEAERRAKEMEAAGLLRRTPRGYLVASQHNREPDLDSPQGLALRAAILNRVRGIVDDAQRALDVRGPQARAGIGVVTLPDTPEVLARATAILAEAEDQLRALADDPGAPIGGPRVRAMMFLGSEAPTRAATPSAP